MSEHIIWSPGVTLDSIEEQVIRKAYSHFRNNKTATANALGIAIRTLDNKLERYGEDEKKREEATQNERRRREIFLQRSRLGAAYQHSMEDMQTIGSDNSTFGNRVESAYGTSEVQSVPLSEPEAVSSMLSIQDATVRARKSR